MWQARNHYVVQSERAMKDLEDNRATPPGPKYSQSALFLMKMGVAPQNKDKAN